MMIFYMHLFERYYNLNKSKVHFIPSVGITMLTSIDVRILLHGTKHSLTPSEIFILRIVKAQKFQYYLRFTPIYAMFRLV